MGGRADHRSLFPRKTGRDPKAGRRALITEQASESYIISHKKRAVMTSEMQVLHCNPFPTDTDKMPDKDIKGAIFCSISLVHIRKKSARVFPIH